jgi:hypothetical protein
MKIAPGRAVKLLSAFAVAGSLTALAQQSSSGIFGGGGGNAFSDPAQRAGARVLEVRVWSGEWVDAVQLTYALQDGSTWAGTKHGGSGGRLSAFQLDSDEYITGLSGRYGKYIDSIRIHTNKRTSDLLGGRGGNQDLKIDVPGGYQGIGFTGRAGLYLDAVGLLYVPIPQAQAGKTSIAGGRGGSEFTDTGIPSGARIVEIRVRAGERLDGIQVVYQMPNGTTGEGTWHGGQGGRSVSFRLDSGEYLTGISGRCGTYVDSIRFHTNQRTSDTFGGRGGNRDFKMDVPAGTQATGFTGRSGIYVDAIGLTYSTSGSTPRRPWRNR